MGRKGNGWGRGSFNSARGKHVARFQALMAVLVDRKVTRRIQLVLFGLGTNWASSTAPPKLAT